MHRVSGDGGGDALVREPFLQGIVLPPRASAQRLPYCIRSPASPAGWLTPPPASKHDCRVNVGGQRGFNFHLRFC